MSTQQKCRLLFWYFPPSSLLRASKKSIGNRPSAYLDETREGLPAQPSTDRRVEDTDARPWKVRAAQAEPEMPAQEDGLHGESLSGGRVAQRRGQSWARKAGAIFDFPPGDHAASLVNTQRLLTFLIAPAKLPCPNFSLWSSPFSVLHQWLDLSSALIIPEGSNPFQVLAFKGHSQCGVSVPPLGYIWGTQWSIWFEARTLWKKTAGGKIVNLVPFF